MSFFDKLERRLGFLAFHNLTLYLIIGQVAMFGMISISGNQAVAWSNMAFSWDAFIGGDFYRIGTFIFTPPPAWWLFLVFAWMVFYLMGTTLESHWGSFRYNLFMLTGFFGALLAGLYEPRNLFFSHYVGISVTFAFAYFHPNFELRLFFILPVKMKWIALIALVGIVLEFIDSSAPNKLVILGSLVNVPLFFWRDVMGRIRSKRRVQEMKEARRKFEEEPFHVCQVCGATDLSHPERDFRYRDEGAICSECSEKEVNT